MSIQAEVNALTANETVRKSLSNFYRCLKTLHLLKNLYLAEALPKQVYSEELSDVQEKLLLLRETLKGHDLQRFSQLWDVEAEFAAFNPEALKSEIRVPISVAKISNFVPQMIDAVLNGENYSDVYEVLSNFTRELAKLRDSEKNLTPLLLRTMDSIASIEREVSSYAGRLAETLDESLRSRLKDEMERFRIEFQRIYF